MLTNALGIMFNELGAAKSKTEVEAVGHKMDIAMKNDAKIQDADFLSLDMDAKFSDDIFKYAPEEIWDDLTKIYFKRHLIVTLGKNPKIKKFMHEERERLIKFANEKCKDPEIAQMAIDYYDELRFIDRSKDNFTEVLSIAKNILDSRKAEEEKLKADREEAEAIIVNGEDKAQVAYLPEAKPVAKKGKKKKDDNKIIDAEVVEEKAATSEEPAKAADQELAVPNKPQGWTEPAEKQNAPAIQQQAPAQPTQPAVAQPVQPVAPQKEERVLPVEIADPQKGIMGPPVQIIPDEKPAEEFNFSYDKKTVVPPSQKYIDPVLPGIVETQVAKVPNLGTFGTTLPNEMQCTTGINNPFFLFKKNNTEVGFLNINGQMQRPATYFTRFDYTSLVGIDAASVLDAINIVFGSPNTYVEIADATKMDYIPVFHFGGFLDNNPTHIQFESEPLANNRKIVITFKMDTGEIGIKF